MLLVTSPLYCFTIFNCSIWDEHTFCFFNKCSKESTPVTVVVRSVEISDISVSVIWVHGGAFGVIQHLNLYRILLRQLLLELQARLKERVTWINSCCVPHTLLWPFHQRGSHCYSPGNWGSSSMIYPSQELGIAYRKVQKVKEEEFEK